MRSDAVPALGSTITIGTGGSARGLVDVQGGSNLDAQLRLNCSAGTHAVVIEGPDHLTGSANYIVKLPHEAPNTPNTCLLYTSPSPRDRQKSRMPSSA